LRLFTFSKTDRILKRAEFLTLSKFGRRLQDRHFIAAFSSGRTGRTRLGITVTKKVGKAVERNRIKRLSREFFRQNRHHLKGVWDINLIAKNGVTPLDSETVFNSLKKLFNGISNSFEN
jgi:ribonuclease P protein component